MTSLGHNEITFKIVVHVYLKFQSGIRLTKLITVRKSVLSSLTSVINLTVEIFLWNFKTLCWNSFPLNMQVGARRLCLLNCFILLIALIKWNTFFYFNTVHCPLENIIWLKNLISTNIHDLCKKCSLYVNGLMQERRNSTANALELRLSCISPSMWSMKTWGLIQYKDVILPV